MHAVADDMLIVTRATKESMTLASTLGLMVVICDATFSVMD